MSFLKVLCDGGTKGLHLDPLAFRRGAVVVPIWHTEEEEQQQEEDLTEILVAVNYRWAPLSACPVASLR